MLGFIIFGWPKKSKTVGAASPGYCDRCRNQSAWYLVKTRRWLSLFWIPFLPLERANYWITCEICQASVEIEDGLVAEAKEMVERTEAYQAGELDDEQYLGYVDEFATSMTPEPSEERELETESTEDIRGFQ